MRRLSLLALLCAAAASAQAPQPRDLVINEIAYDPPPAQGSSNEWVELYNRSGEAVDLGRLALADAVTTVSLPAGAGLLAPGAYAVLVRDPALFEAFYPGVPFVAVPGFPALNNGGDTVSILHDGAVIDRVPYLPAWGGTDASLERLDPDGPSASASNWATTTAPGGGTPGAQNSVFAPDTEPPALLGTAALSATEVEVRFSEPVDPVTAGDPSRYQIDGGVGQPAAVAVAPEGDEAHVLLTLAVALQPNTPYTLTVAGVADLAGNVLQSAQTTVFFGQGAVPAPRDLVVNEILYDEPAANSPGEFVELYNRSDRVFDLSEFTLSDAVGTVPVTAEPAFVEPGGYVVLVESAAAFAAVFPDVPYVAPPSWRALNDSGDAVVLAHASGVTVDSLFYDDAWGGRDRSLERRDPDGPSGFAVNWATTTALLGTPGVQNSQFQPDTQGPRVEAAEVTGGGGVLHVTFDEPLDPGTVSPGAFTVTTVGGAPAASVAAAAYLGDGPPTVRLTLGAPLAAGAYSLTPRLVTDLLGNITPGEPFAFAYAPDVTPPALALAFALDPLTVEVAFSEPVTAETAGDPASYTIDGEIGRPEGVAFPLTGDATRAALTLAAPLEERVRYTLTVTGVADAEGNRLESATFPLFLGAGDVPAPGDLVVNEVMFDPVGGSTGEYVELLNRTDRLFLLSELVLADDPAGGGNPVSAVPVVVPPGGYVVVVANRAAFAARFPEAPAPVVQAARFPSLNNTGDTVALLYAGAVIDAVTYDPRWHRVELEDATGVALERVDPAGPSGSASNWSSSRDPRGGTPGAPNSVFVTPGEPPGETGLTVDSPFDPVGGSTGEYVELLNRTDRLFLLSELVLADDPAGGGNPVSAVPVVVPPGGYVVVVANRAAFAARFPEAPAPVVQAARFPSLNNTGDTVALLHAGTVIDAVAYDPRWHRVELEDATGVALERVDPAGPSDSASNWSSSLDPRGGTPGAPNSVFTTPGDPPAETGLTVDSPFDPDGGQSTAIRFTLETDAALIRVRIFDGAGRLVRRLEEGDFVGREGAVLWDGRGEDGRRLRIGPYVVLLEAVNVEGGTTEAHRAAVVLARRF